MLSALAILLLSCQAFIKHASTGKFLPDEFNVTEIEERNKWEGTRTHIKCGVCRMVAAYAFQRLDVATAGEEAVHTFLEGVCEAPDAELFHRFRIADDGSGSWDVRPALDPDDRREDIVKWHALSMRDTCSFSIPPNDEAIVDALRRCRDEPQRMQCVCDAASLCPRRPRPRAAPAAEGEGHAAPRRSAAEGAKEEV